MRKRWIWCNTKRRLVPEAEYRRVTPKQVRPGSTIIPDDFEPVKSPVDRSVLTSRSDVRRHNERNGVVDVGNDPWYEKPKPYTPYEAPGLEREIARLMRR